MSWLEFVIECESEAIESIESILLTSGAQAITLLDAGDQPLLEPLPGEMPLWSLVRIKALFARDIDQGHVESSLHEQKAGYYGYWQVLQEQEWSRVWLERFKPTRYGQRLWIIPSESQPPSSTAVNIFLDPGLAFGTGDHATTNLCLCWLDGTSLQGRRVLDFGHGSGILAIAAKKLGATYVMGVDIDPQAVIAGRQNAKNNELNSNIEFSDHTQQQDFDVVIANILAGPLRNMAENLSTSLRPGGKIALSGILEGQITEVQQAYSPWIMWETMQKLEGWVLIAGRRREAQMEQSR
ncbi:MAG: 50S ribosomal protein L11 methyltransferase [Gammaproteobacteria bacterium]|nr:50S ribosomal protein L11 methyltransferase [Gammaproteobacteria bacterium]